MEMLVGFPYLLTQTAAVLVIAAVLAAGLGWFIGRGSRRQSEETLERALAAFRRLDVEASAFAPVTAAAAGSQPSEHAASASTNGPSGAVGMGRFPYAGAPIQHVPLHDDVTSPYTPAWEEVDSADLTVLRPAPQSGPSASVPDPTIIRSVPDASAARVAPDSTVLRPAADGTVLRPAADATVLRAPDGTVIRPPVHSPEGLYGGGTVIRRPPGMSLPQAGSPAAPVTDDVSSLRPDPRDPDLEAGRIEAAALAAWDRTVPMLEQQLRDLAAQNDELRHKVREAEK
ncbi:MAG: hypothetical protein HY829_05385 [Actinobacteria bacterium]|nr:hypothetical protein [Actinomycetota bacterium]